MKDMKGTVTLMIKSKIELTEDDTEGELKTGWI
jgi:hypothetical protein